LPYEIRLSSALKKQATLRILFIKTCDFLGGLNYMKYRVGIDVGGTFTDFVSIDDDGRISVVKSSSTPGDSSIGMEDTIVKAGINMKDAGILVHGCTVGANTVIENKGARTAIITTKGFRDIIELRRGQRVIDKPSDMYNLQMDLPQDYVGGYSPLVSRPYRFEIPERVDYQGNVLFELDEKAVRDAAFKCKERGVESIVVCYYFSFVNPSHEQRTKEIMQEILPDVCITLSSEILPVIREYERMSTATVNGYIMPIMQKYLSNVRTKLQRRGYNKEFYVMQSNGGIMSSLIAGQRPVNALDSGPAGGVTAAADLGMKLGFPLKRRACGLVLTLMLHPPV